MSSYIVFDKHATVCIEDDGGKRFLQIMVEGQRMRTKITPDIARAMAYHGSLIYKEMTGESALLAIPIQEADTRPTSNSAGSGGAPIARTRTRSFRNPGAG